MNLKTNLSGRLRNTKLPYSNSLLPLFEAVVNSIHSIEDSGANMDDGEIKIEVLRSPSNTEMRFIKQGPTPKEEIIGFKVSDTGIGFTDENFRSFNTLDSEYKADRGGKGIGRLLWLKAFDAVSITSVFEENKKKQKRSFNFNHTQGVSDTYISELKDSEEIKTIVDLQGFDKKYRDHSPKTNISIADSIIEHCLWYFVRDGSAPRMYVVDQNEDDIFLNERFDHHMHSGAHHEIINIEKQRFELTHVKFRSTLKKDHYISYCADNRVVIEEKISGKIQGLYRALYDKDEEFSYSCYVSSTYLDEGVNTERTGFQLTDDSNGFFSDEMIGEQKIHRGILKRSEHYLSDHLKANIDKGKSRLNNFVSKKAPKYRPILKHLTDKQLNIDPEITDKDLELTLHKAYSQIEEDMLAEGHELKSCPEKISPDQYERKIKSYLEKVNDIKKSDLANYVSHRKVIIDLLVDATKKTPEGNYVKEEIIHNLIMPMRVHSDETESNSANLWLIDERLAFHDYLASDKPIETYPLEQSNDRKEPDIAMINVWDKPLLVNEGDKLPLSSITVVEIKRPMRNDASKGEDHDPVEQAVGYLKRIRQGKVQTSQGRLIPESDKIPGFCYIIADLTPKLKERCINVHDMTLTHDYLGFFKYNTNIKAYIEVISFDRLINIAKERNRAFFDALGFPCT